MFLDVREGVTVFFFYCTIGSAKCVTDDCCCKEIELPATLGVALLHSLVDCSVYSFQTTTASLTWATVIAGVIYFQVRRAVLCYLLPLL